MADPFTLSLIAANCAWALIQNRADAAAVAGAKRLAQSLRKDRTPANHDVLKATHAAFVRSIQLMADACDDAGADKQDHFAARALARVAKDREFTTFRADAAIPKRELDANIRAIFEGAGADPGRNAAEAAIAGLETAMGVPLTETFRALFRHGSDWHRSWPEAFALFFAEEVKTNDRVFRALAFDRVNEILAFADAHRAELAAMNDAIASFRGELQQGFDALHEQTSDIGADVKEILARLSSQVHDAPIALLRSLAEAFGEARPDADAAELEAYLRGRIGDYHQLRERIEAVQHEDNHDAALLADANCAIAEGDFDAADRLLSEAEELLDERVDRLLVRKAERRALRGDAAHLSGNFEVAVAHFDAAAEMLPKEAEKARLDLEWSAAQAATEWGQRIEPLATGDSVRRWRQLANSVDPATAGRQWGDLQNNLGIALTTLGRDQEKAELLEEAVVAFRAALEVKSRNQAQLEWAITQNNIGNVLSTLSQRREGTGELDEAIAAYEAALEVCTRDRSPPDWAMIQNNLGSALLKLGERGAGTESLDEAINAFRAALEVHTREMFPLEWAMAQNNLANALATMGERQDGTEPLEQAVTAFRAALEIRTRDRLPLDWALTQNNLGTVLQSIAERKQGTLALEEAIAAYRLALEIRTRDRMPVQWATTQNNLGTALRTLGERLDQREILEDAVAAYQAALEVRSRDQLPLDWATTQNNLANVLSLLGTRNEGTAELDEAAAASRAALEIYDQARFPVIWASVQNNLGITLTRLGRRQTGTGTLDQAVIAFRTALASIKREELPINWATLQRNLGFALIASAERRGDCNVAREAVTAFECALEVSTHPDLEWDRDYIEIGLVQARAVQERLCVNEFTND